MGWLIIILGSAFCLAQVRCATVDIVNQPIPPGPSVSMILVSNRLETRFRIREQRLDYTGDTGWWDVGVGEQVEVKLKQNVRYEIEANVAGCTPKRVKLTEPLGKYDFRFLLADCQAKARLSCDLHLVRASDGTHMCGGASVHGDVGDLDALASDLARQLLTCDAIKGASIAVVGLRDRSHLSIGRAVAEELPDKIANALSATVGLHVLERNNITPFLEELDLADSGIAEVLRKRPVLRGVQFYVLGAVTMEPYDRP